MKSKIRLILQLIVMGKRANDFEFALPARTLKASDYTDPVTKAKQRKLGNSVE